MKSVLFLGYDRNQTSLIDELENRGAKVRQTSDPLDGPVTEDVAVSFGYRHILRKHHLSGAPVYNLHIAYLPWNRGAHPNFWSFHDGAPAGVTIHLIDEGIDTGPIVAQELVEFPSHMTTFAQTYAHLLERIEALCMANIDAILSGDVRPVPQKGEGTVHRIRDLPEDLTSWDVDIQRYFQGTCSK